MENTQRNAQKRWWYIIAGAVKRQWRRRGFQMPMIWKIAACLLPANGFFSLFLAWIDGKKFSHSVLQLRVANRAFSNYSIVIDSLIYIFLILLCFFCSSLFVFFIFFSLITTLNIICATWGYLLTFLTLTEATSAASNFTTFVFF